MTVDLFIPCSIDRFLPETGWNIVRLLEYLGLDVNYHTEQSCCGLTALNNGLTEDAKRLGEKFISDFEGNQTIVIPSPACAQMIRDQYPVLFHNTSFHVKSSRLRQRTWELTSFIVNKLNIQEISSRFDDTVVYFESCSERKYGLQGAPLKLLRKVRGIRLLELEHPEICCGQGGSMALHHPEISYRMAERKVQDAMASGAHYVTSAEASCLLHLQAYIRKNNLPLKAVHIADILASGL